MSGKICFLAFWDLQILMLINHTLPASHIEIIHLKMSPFFLVLVLDLVFLLKLFPRCTSIKSGPVIIRGFHARIREFTFYEHTFWELSDAINYEFMFTCMICQHSIFAEDMYIIHCVSTRYSMTGESETAALNALNNFTIDWRQINDFEFAFKSCEPNTSQPSFSIAVIVVG